MKNTIIAVLAVVLLLVSMAPEAKASRLLTEEQALEQMLPGADRVEKVPHTLTDAELNKIAQRLGGSILLDSKKDIKEAMDYTFYFGYKGDKKIGVAVFDQQPGKWGPVDFIVALNPDNASVNDMAVTAYVEKRGRPIALKSFTSQFIGKTSKDAFEVNKDIRSISGATISVKCAAFQVQKIIILYEEVFLNKPAVKPAETAKPAPKPLIERLSDCDLATRTQAYNEFNKSSQAEKDKLLQEIISDLNKKEYTECQKKAINFVLRSYTNSEEIKKLQGMKLPAGITLDNNFEGALNKIAEAGKLNITWEDESLQESAKHVELTEQPEIKKEDTVYTILENIIDNHNGHNHKDKKDTKEAKKDNVPAYTYLIEKDGIKIVDLSSTFKYWQKWWASNNGKSDKGDKN